MQTTSPPARSKHANRSSLTPATPSRGFQQSGPSLSQQARASPSTSTLQMSPRRNLSGPVRFPMMLVQKALTINTNGMLTQTPWALPALDVSTAMLLTAVAMEVDGNVDPSTNSGPHTGLYWHNSTQRIQFFDYVVTIINKLCALLGHVTGSIVVVEAISTDDRNHQMRYSSPVIHSIPQGHNTIASISGQVVELAAYACDPSFKQDRRTQYDDERDILTVWASNGGYRPAKWGDAPLPIRFDHSLVGAIRAVLRSQATEVPPSPFLSSHAINFVLSPAIRFKPDRRPLDHSVMPRIPAVEEEELEYTNEVEEDGDKGNETNEEEWVPFARYKGLKEAIEGAWCTQFGISPEYVDGVRLMMYEENQDEWATYLKGYFKVKPGVAQNMAEELQSYVDQL